jgi:hypothetical protein
MKPASTTGILRPSTRERHGIITRHDALKRRLPRYFTGYPCAKGHIAESDTKTGKCCECSGTHVDKS